MRWNPFYAYHTPQSVIDKIVTKKTVVIHDTYGIFWNNFTVPCYEVR